MADNIDTSPEAVPVDTSTSRIRKLQELGCADYIHAALAAERDTLSARVAELEERCLHLSKGEARLSGLLNERASELAAAEQRAATLEERYLAVVGDKINLRGEVATLEAERDELQRLLQFHSK